jgi:hypothetical protein
MGSTVGWFKSSTGMWQFKGVGGEVYLYKYNLYGPGRPYYLVRTPLCAAIKVQDGEGDEEAQQKAIAKYKTLLEDELNRLAADREES